MSNMKNVALIDLEVKRARAETTADIAAALAVIHDELAPMQEAIMRLRAYVDELMDQPSPSSSA